MKFGHAFQEHLQKDGFPPHWIASAISYRQLKKCIKKVQRELTGLGLDAETLNHLLNHVAGKEGAQGETGEEEEKPFRYLLSKAEDENGKGEAEQSSARRIPFRPKLLFAVDEATGEPLDASLAPETRQYLHELALSQQLGNARITELPESEDDSIRPGRPRSPASFSSDEPLTVENASRRYSHAYRMIEVPLTSDSEFFTTLQTELSGLTDLQADEQRRLNLQVSDLGKAVVKVTEPVRSAKHHDLDKWRKIFELYLESRIFFATNEQDHGAHDFAKADKNMRMFSDQLQQHRFMTTFRRKESVEALERFMKINMELLQSLRFQEINQMAMTKILKKFDKRTRLGVAPTFPQTLLSTALSENVAKAVCYQVSTELLPVVPQLDDYLCPVCFSISYRPIRLRCGHVFCIRCLVVMQRAKEDCCPLCRGKVVMEADSTNIDPALANFLLKYFPDEVRGKQHDNERAAGTDRYGEAYNDKCAVM